MSETIREIKCQGWHECKNKIKMNFFFERSHLQNPTEAMGRGGLVESNSKMLFENQNFIKHVLFTNAII